MSEPTTLTVYVTIDNGDEELSQREWSRLVTRVDILFGGRVDVRRGFWFSSSFAMWQNACWCVQFTQRDDETAEAFTVRVAEYKGTLALIAREFRQDSISWAVAEVELITSPTRTAR